MRPSDAGKSRDVKAASQTQVSFADGVLQIKGARGTLGPSGSVEITVQLPAGSRVEAKAASDSKADLEAEQQGATLYRELIAHAETVRDYVTRDLAREILADEEKHIDFIETQFEMIQRMGLQNYLQLQSEGAEEE